MLGVNPVAGGSTITVVFSLCNAGAIESDWEDRRGCGLNRPLGCREKRAPTWRKDAPLSGLPAAAGSANWRVDRFHVPLCTAVCMPVQEVAAFCVISASPIVRSDPSFIFYPAARRAQEQRSRFGAIGYGSVSFERDPGGTI